MWPSGSSISIRNNSCNSDDGCDMCSTFCKNSDLSIMSFDGQALGNHRPNGDDDDNNNDDNNNDDNIDGDYLSCDDNSITMVSVIGLILIRHRNSEQ